MESRIETLPPKKLVGLSMEMTQSDDKTPELWAEFMARRDAIPHRVGSSVYSIQVLNSNGRQITDRTPYTKWAAVEVEKTEALPSGLQSYRLAGGLYAVFVHRGPATAFPDSARFIYGQWMPGSGYALDDREHFERLPESYRPDDPDAVEEIWIPVRKT